MGSPFKHFLKGDQHEVTLFRDSSKKTSKKTIIMFSLKKNVCISTISDGLFVNVYGKQMYQNVYSVVVK